MSAALAPAVAYEPRRPSRSSFAAIRGCRHHLREWGPRTGRPLILLHGARDASASFQFVVDALPDEWRVVAPDWRGHGLTDWSQGGYWQAEFLSDLDAILRLVEPEGALAIVGHSMGGNIASLYAGIRPDRVRRLVILDALGEHLDRDPVDIVSVLTLVLDSQAEPRPKRSYAAVPQLAERLRRENARLDEARAAFLAVAHARPRPDGRVSWPFDPAFRRSFPSLHDAAGWGAVWSRIACPVLALLSSDERPGAPTSDPDVTAARAAFFRDLTLRHLPDTGHNLHHDAPDAVAAAIVEFLGGSAQALSPVDSQPTSQQSRTKFENGPPLVGGLGETDVRACSLPGGGDPSC